MSSKKWFQVGRRNKTQLRSLMPSIETFERRELMASGLVQGVAFADTAGTGKLAYGEGLAGATMKLTGGPAGFVTQTTVTDAGGNYSFGGLATGVYTLTETPPSGYTQSGTQAFSDFDPSSTSPSSITVTVIDPSATTVSQTYDVQPPTKYGIVASYNGFMRSLVVGQNETYLTSPALATTTNPTGKTPELYPFCVDLNGNIQPGDTWPVVPSAMSTSGIPNAGQIGYLYDTYAAGQGLLDIYHGPALQLAIWELEYDPGDIGGGVTSYTDQLNPGNDQGNFYIPATTDANVQAIVNIAYSYLNDSIGKSEPALFLKSTAAPNADGQSMVGGESFNFGNTKVIKPDAISVISGTIFADCNNDSKQNNGESGISGVTVKLTGTDITGASVNATTTTNSAGAYSFNGLVASNNAGYTVTETPPAGYIHEGEVVGSTGGTINLAADSITTVLPADSTSAGNNFAEIMPGSIAGTVYVDATGNGLSGDDTPESGVVVKLFASNGTTLIASQTTGSSGAYSFTGLVPGNYVVQETPPSGYLQTAPASFTYTDSVSACQSITNQNFANYNESCDLSSIQHICYTVTTPTGVVTHPSTLNGALISGDTVQVSFTWAGTTNDQLTLVSYTAPNGNFNTSNLQQQVIFDTATTAVSPGTKTYTLSITVPSGYFQVDFVCGAAINTLATGPNVYYHSQNRYIDGQQGGSTPDVNNSGVISGTVFADANNNGLFGTGDTAIANDKVTLTGTDYLGNPVNVTTMTNSSGQYSFTGLNPSVDAGYTITEAAPAGYYAGIDTPGSTGGVAGTRTITGVKLNFGQTSSGNNFAELLPTSISGTVYTDITGNGLSGDDTPESGVTVYLVNSNIQVISTAVTGANGAYAFTNLVPGTYYVAEGTPSGYTETAPSSGYYADSLSPGQPISGQNFANFLPASISGTVYNDANGDDALSPGESGIGGITVTLLNSTGGTVATTTSASNGTYSFGNLAPGTYSIQEGATPGYNRENATPGTSGGTPWWGAITGFTLAAGTNDTGNNFGQYLPSTISGTVYNDVTANGLSGDDTALGGVPVSLLNASGTTVATTTSNATTGAFAFTGVAPGTYTVKETVPAGYVQTSVASYTVTPTSGSTSPNNNFDNAAFSAISGTIFADSNANLKQDNGEAGLSGVTVTLTGKNNLGASISLTTTTNSAGAYSFPNLLASSTGYTISASPPSGYLNEGVVVGSTGGSAGSNAISAPLPTGTTSSGNNFVEVLPAMVSGLVFADNNCNGVLDCGETGLSGVTVKLTGTNVQGQAVSLSTVTVSNGSYSFSGLLPSNSSGYTLTETLPSGYTATKNSVGTVAGSADGSLSGSTAISSIKLNAGNAGTNYNFGETTFCSTNSCVSVKCGDFANSNFWANCWGGQSLINSLGSGCNDTKLATWLTTNYPNLYPTSLIGTTNASVASAFCKLNSNCKTALEADTMAVTLSCYVTNKNLAGCNAQWWGFNVTSNGSGCDTYNMGNSGACFGLQNNCNYTAQTMLSYMNSMASCGSVTGCSYQSSQWNAMDWMFNTWQNAGGICW